MGEYILRCPVCRTTIEDHYTNECPNGCFGLIQSEYSEKHLTVHNEHKGIFRFSDWLCCHNFVPTDAGPVTYPAQALGHELGLSHLYICFNGYWPERGAFLKTCSFKELEALPTMQRRTETTRSILQISSAGNTGRAFAQVSADGNIPVVITIPKTAQQSLWTVTEAESVFLVTVDGDYSDAIAAGNRICDIGGIVPEGGAKNPARRDGMGTAMLDAATFIGRMPDWYFQAVGSGTGGIAAWEMAKRLIQDGRFGLRLPRLYLSQSEPFTPMVRAWNAGRREIIADLDMPDAKTAVSQVYSPVLTNRNPPYSINGGVFDALSASRGMMNAVTTTEASKARAFFEDCEGIDLDPAAAVSVASLIKATETGEVQGDDTVLLHITGGGYKRVKEDYDQRCVEPSAHLSSSTPNHEILAELTRWKAQYE